MFKLRWFFALSLSLLVLLPLQGCEKTIPVKLVYKIEKDDIVFKIRAKKSARYVLKSPDVSAWSRYGYHYENMSFRKIRFPLKDLKAGTYKVSIRLYNSTTFTKLKGNTTISVKVPVRARLEFKGCEVAKSGVELKLSMKPGSLRNRKCALKQDGKLVLRFKGTPETKLVVDGQTFKTDTHGKASVALTLLPLLVQAPVKGIAAALPVKKSKKYKSTYVSSMGLKSLFKKFTAILDHKGKKVTRHFTLELSPLEFEDSARLLSKLVQKGVKLSLNPDAKGLLYIHDKYTIQTFDQIKTLRDVRFYAIRRYVSRRKTRVCRYNRSGLVPQYGNIHEVKVFGGEDVTTKLFKAGRSACPLVLVTRRGEKKEVVNTVPTWKIGRWLSKLRR
jgi:hypothetical protein